MNSGSTQFVPSARLGFCKQSHLISMWDEFKTSSYLDSTHPVIMEIETIPENQLMDTNSHVKIIASSQRSDQEQSKPEKVLRRQAQNREAARKSRLRKKAYVQQLEKCKEKLRELEQHRDHARKQVDGSLDSNQTGAEPYTGTINQVIAAFDMEYKRWIEEQNRLIFELRNALNSNIGDMELIVLVESGLRQYYHLFSMKALAVKADAFYIVSGLWRTSAERLFFWIGGFRPSEVLKVVSPQMELLSEQQMLEISVLRRSCQQAEDALTQGMEKLHQIVAETIAGEGNHHRRVGVAMEKLQGLVIFVGQADHLRRETLQQISRLLSPRQAAQGLLALGDYIQRLQALSLAWNTRQTT